MKSHQLSDQADFIIVGAGLSGLTAAYRLQQQGFHVLVLEAGNEVGGRTKTKILNGIPFDLGGQFVGKRHSRILSLCKTLGLHLSQSQLRGPITWFIKNRRQLSYLPPLGFKDTIKFLAIILKLSYTAHKIDEGKPWQSKNASKYDQISFGEWLKNQNVNESLFALFKGIIEGYASVPLSNISFLHVLWWISRSGGVMKALKDGSNLMIEEGAQAISKALAQKIREQIFFNSFVTSICIENEKVKVSTNSNFFTALFVIVTAPVSALKYINFDPPLPENFQRMISEVESSKASSVVALLKTEEKIHSHVAINHKIFPLAWRNKLKLKGITYEKLQKNEYSEYLSSCFTDQKDKIEASAIEDWGANPYLTGTYAIFKPGQLTKYGPLLSMSFGRIFFAGSERSTWVNSMEGAIESGEQVADQVIKIFNKH